MQKTLFHVKNLWKCIFRASKRVSFPYFPYIALNHGGLSHNIFYNFCGSCYNIQFKPCATSKMELFVVKNR